MRWKRTHRRRTVSLNSTSPANSANGPAIAVHRILGPGLLNSISHRCLCHELKLRGIAHEGQVPFPINYKGTALGDDLGIDIVVGGCVLLELNAVSELEPVHEAQLFTNLKLGKIPLGPFVNFNVR